MNKIPKFLLLLIDDDESDRLACIKALSSLSADIIEAINGKDTLECLEKQKFDCAILDYILPDYNGLALVKEIRSRGYKTPIVITTGHGDERLVVDMLKAGAQDYIPKDKLQDLLLICVTNAINSSKTAKESEYYRNFYDNAPIGFCTTKLSDGTFMKANNTLVEMLEYDSLQDLIDNITAIDTHPDRQARDKLVENILKNGTLTNYEMPLKTKSGKIKWFSFNGRLCKGMCQTEGKCLPNCMGERCIECSLVDITEKKALQLKVRELKEKQLAILLDTQKAIQEKLKAYA